MISRLVSFALRMPSAVALLAFFAVCGGLYAYKNLDIEAYPNPVPPMVEVITQPNGWRAEEVERYVTVPARDRPLGHGASRPHPLAVALRAVAT